MKKLISILLVVLLIFDSCIYVFIYLELSNYFKKEGAKIINEFIPANELDVISIHKTDLVSISSDIIFLNDNEFIYKNELYDIYNIITTEDSIHYYCINDKKENLLEKAFSSYIDYKTTENSKNTPVNNILHNIIKVAVTPTHYCCNICRCCIHIVNRDVLFTSQCITDIPTPPPKSLS